MFRDYIRQHRTKGHFHNWIFYIYPWDSGLVEIVLHPFIWNDTFAMQQFLTLLDLESDPCLCRERQATL